MSEPVAASAPPDGGSGREPAIDSRRLVSDALAVVRRGAQLTSVGSVAYVVYVVVLLGAVYLFPYGHVVFAALGRSGLVDVLTDPVGAGALVLAVVAAPVVAHRVGRVRGPVAPPMLWVRHVVAGPADRAVSLRRWWLLLGGAVLAAAAALGLLLALALWSAAVVGPLGALGVTAASVLLGAVVARAWLAGQVAADGGGHPLRPADALRRLTEQGLGRQRDRGEGVYGSFLSGQRTALVRELGGRPPRHLGRLRPGRAMLLRRDLLAVRRGPGLVRAALLLALGGLGVGLLTPRSAVLGVLVSLVLYQGVVAWATGLRGQSAPLVPVLGWGPRRETLGHLVLPGVAALVGGLVAVAVATGLGDPGVTTALVAVLVPLHLWVVTWTTHRAAPPLVTVMPQSVIPRVVAWWLLPAGVLLGVPALAAYLAV